MRPCVAGLPGALENVTADCLWKTSTRLLRNDAVFDNLYAVQFYQKEKGKAIFRYQPTKHFNPSQLESIKEKVTNKLGDDFEISFQKVEEMDKTQRGKHRWLVSDI